MASCKTMVNCNVDSVMHCPPSTSSPLRRRSMILRKEGAVNFSENDDEAERQARRCESVSVKGTNNSSGNDSGKRRSVNFLLRQLSASEIAARVSQCIKLNAENKISVKNAFSLEMIDFMNYMVKKQDSNMSDLQVASTSLDVSTKIYGFRVDGVHTEILKMVGGLDKQVVAEESIGENEAVAMPTKQKKKRNKQKIISTLEALKGAIDTMNPASLMMIEGDIQTTDMLYQSTLPNHLHSGFYLHQFNDMILDSMDENEAKSEMPRSEKIETTIPKIDSIHDTEICPSFVNFEFHGWSADDEVDEDDSEEDIDNRFQFDLNASLPRDDGHDPVGRSYFDVNDEHENVAGFQNLVNTVENIVDFRQVVMAPSSAKSLEYSFIHESVKSHWAGPSHWKITIFHKNHLRGAKAETCRQAPVRKRKDVELAYTKEAKAAINEKFLPSRTVKIQPKTARIDWHEEDITLPEDIHYNISQNYKLYLHPELTIRHPDKDEMNTTQLHSEGEDYDYNNENDTSNYCPNVDNPDYHGGDNNDDNDTEFRPDDSVMTSGTQMAFTGDNLVAAPKQVNKILIPYSTRPKKIDMRQLKRSIWKSLVSAKVEEHTSIQTAVDKESENKVDGCKRFSNVYKELPNRMSKNNVEALSFPVAFVSLLHLANEKTLNITGLKDLSDIIVEQN